MRYSVVVPIYKVEQYIHQCIDSILNQKFKDFELILVDDASPDHCPAICDWYAERDQRVRVIHHEFNKGLVGARQSGCAIAMGEYVICVDGDDWVDTNYLVSVEDIVCRYSPDIVAFAFNKEIQEKRRYYSNNLPEGLYTGKKLARIYNNVPLFTNGILPSLCNKCFKRELYVHRQLQVHADIYWFEDGVCATLCLLDASSVYISPQAFYHYRMNPSSMSNTFQPEALQNLYRLIACLEERVDLERYGIEHSVKVLVVRQLHGILVNHYKHVGWYSAKAALNKNIDKLYELMPMNSSVSGLKNKVILFTIKNRLWTLHYVLYKLYFVCRGKFLE